MKNFTTVALLCLGLVGPVCAQQSQTDTDTLNRYAGTWAVDCGKPGARLTVSTETLTLSASGKRIRTAAPVSAFSYYGKMEPPKGFDVALLGEAHPTGLSFLAMNDQSGSYLTVDEDPQLQKQFGKTALAGKFRRCR